MEILEREHHRLGGADPLEEQPPAAEQVSPVGGGALFEAEQVSQPRLHQAALALVGDVLPHCNAQLLARGGRVLLLDDPRPGPDHLGQRPVGHAFAVGEASALVPAHQLLDAVDVLEELPEQPRLARSGLPTTVTRRARPSATVASNDSIDHHQLALASHERRLETGRAACAADAGHHAQRGPSPHRLLAALDLVLPASS